MELPLYYHQLPRVGDCGGDRSNTQARAAGTPDGGPPARTGQRVPASQLKQRESREKKRQRNRGRNAETEKAMAHPHRRHNNKPPTQPMPGRRAASGHAAVKRTAALPVPLSGGACVPPRSCEPGRFLPPAPNPTRPCNSLPSDPNRPGPKRPPPNTRQNVARGSTPPAAAAWRQAATTSRPQKKKSENSCKPKNPLV